MNMDTLARLSLEAAKEITGTGGKDAHTQDVAYKLACLSMAEEAQHNKPTNNSTKEV